MKKKFYITTPIYYVNDIPHIGHTTTTIAADIIARYHRLLGEDVFFLTGTDEHGAKVAEEAKKMGLSPLAFADKVSHTFADIWPKLNISHDYFIRTTNPKHKQVVQEIIQKIYDRGDIYKARYEGLYCVGCEKFITTAELVDDKCPLHPNKELEKQSEENYFFKLKKYAPLLIKAIENENDKNHYKISPEAKKQEILSKLKAGVPDLSISRANVAWGIPIPWDQIQTIYVWFDALLNYYSALEINENKDFWPPNLHLVGKEILWFHAAIWEAMLISAEIPLPKEIFSHSFYTIDGQKMSKSLGNVISPQQMLEKFGVDGTRYLMATSFPYDHDSDVSLSKFTEKYNADLANGLGNLVARTLALAIEHCNGKVPTPDKDLDSHPLRVDEKIYNWKRAWNDIDQSILNYQVNFALEAVWKFISEADRYIDQNKPWELATKDKKQFEWVIYGLLDSIHQIAWQIYPFMPETAREIGRRLNIEKILTENPIYKDSWTNIKPGTSIKSGPPLFPRLA